MRWQSPVHGSELSVRAKTLIVKDILFLPVYTWRSRYDPDPLERSLAGILALIFAVAVWGMPLWGAVALVQWVLS